MFEFLEDWGVELELAMFAIPAWLVFCGLGYVVFNYWANNGLILSWATRIILWIVQLPLTYFIFKWIRDRD